MTTSKSVLGLLSPQEGESEQTAISRQSYLDAQKKLLETYENRNQLFDPVLLAMAQGFLSPTKSGTFGEGLSNVIGQVTPVVEQQNKQARELAQMKAELAAQELGARTEADKRNLMGQLYAKQGDDEEIAVDPEKALQLFRITGDPKYAELAMGRQEEKRRKKTAAGMFEEVLIPGKDGAPETKEMRFNPSAAVEIVKNSKDPVKALSDFSEMMKKVRQAGLMGGRNTESTPFDAIITMSSSLGDQSTPFKNQAERLAQQYRSGMIDEDKANSLAQQMLQSGSSIIERQASREQANAWRQVTTAISQGHLQLAGANLALAREQAADRADQRRKENEGKLTDEQKYTLKTYVGPIVQEGIKAQSAIMRLQQLRDVVERAPSGAFKGAMASSVGALFGTDENTALRNLESLSKSLITEIPRLPGAASNLDAQNLEKSIGRLQSPMLTNQQRRDIIVEIEKGFKRASERANRVEAHWEANKKYDPKILEGDSKAAGQSSNYPRPTSNDLKWYMEAGPSQKPALRESFKNKFGKYPEEF